LGAAAAVLISAIAAKFNRAHIAHWSHFPGDAIKAALLGATLISLIKCTYHMKNVLSPQVESGFEASRFSWPWVENTSIDALTQLPATSSRREAWAQAKMLAVIAKKKHRNFRLALWWFAAAAGIFLLWIAALAWFA
jgi:hypothetical protein